MRICTLFIFTALLLISSYPLQARTIDKTTALVNSDVITLSDILSFQKNFSLRKEIDPFIGFFRLAPQKSSEIIDYLIQEKLILQKFPTTKEEAEEEINSVQKNNQINREKLIAVLSSQGIKFDDYMALIKISVAKRKLMERELRPLSNISEDDIKNYYYTAPEFLEKTKNQNLVLTYNLSQMAIPNQTIANTITKRLKAGEDFDALSSEFSSMGVENSSLGNISEENLSPLIHKSLTGLKVGEATAALAAGGGYQILKINSIGAPKDPIFEKNKEAIRNRLFQKTMFSQLSVWASKERAQAYIYIP